MRKKRNEKGGKKRKIAWVEIQEKEEQPMINLNEAKLMNKEDWIETTQMRKKIEETDGEICKIGKKIITGWELQETTEEE